MKGMRPHSQSNTNMKCLQIRVELEFGFYRFRLHNKHTKVVNPTSGRQNWTICHRNERDGHKRHMLFFYRTAGDRQI